MKKRMMSVLYLLIIACIGLAQTAYASEEGGGSGVYDNDPPQIISASIDKNGQTINYDSTNDNNNKVTVTAVFTDERTYVQKGNITFRSDNGGYLSTSLTSTGTGNTFSGTIYINKYDRSGEYKINSISATDAADNVCSLSRSQMSGSMAGLKFTVAGTVEDTTGPEISDIKLEKTEVTAPGQIYITAKVTDDISGLSSGIVYFYNDDFNRYLSFSLHVENSDETKSPKEYSVKGTCYLDKYTRLGEYNISSISLYDKSENYSSYYKNNRSFPSGASGLKFNVKNGEGYVFDNTAPVLQDITLAKKDVTAPGYIKVFAKAYDTVSSNDTSHEAYGEFATEASGIDYFYVSYYNILPIYSGRYFTAYLRPYDGDDSPYEDKDNVFMGEITVDQYARPNDYKLRSISLEDKADNSRSEGIPEELKEQTFEVFNGGAVNYGKRGNTDNALEKVEEAGDKEQVLIHYTEEKDTLSENVLKAIKGKDVTVTYENKGVQWIFNGMYINDETNIKDLNLNVNFSSIEDFPDSDEKERINNITGGAPTAVISFPENGQLPGPMTIRIKTDANLRAFLGKEEGLYIYYYDNTYKRMSKVAADVVIGEDQYFEFTIYHCSDYVLSTVELPEQLMTPENVRWSEEDKTVAAWDDAGGAYYDVDLRVEHGADAEERSLKVNGTSKDLRAEIGRLFALFNVEKPDEITGVKFRVRANDGEDETGIDSEWSEWVEDSGFRPVVLQPPVTLSWNGTEKTTASWNEVPNADSYYVLLRVDYGGAHKQTSLVTKNTSVELKSRIDNLFDTIEDESMVSSVSYRVYCKPSNDGLFLKSEWSGSSPDSGYRRSDEGGESGSGETVVKPRVVAVKGKKSLATASFKAAKWESGNKNIATVDPQGVVTGKKPGEVVITAYGEGANPDTRNYTVIVEKPVLKNKTIYTKDSFDLEKSITGVDKLVATGYVSANPEVLEVDDLGYVTVKKSGKAKLTVEYGSVKVSAVYTVKLPNLKEASVSLLEGKGKKLTTVNKVKSLTITYKSSDENIATVDSNGKVKAVAPGTAGISLLVDGNVYDNCRITVKAPELTNKKDPVELKKNKTYQLKVKNKTKNVSYKSSNEDVVTVTKNGKVKGKAEGEAYVYLLLNGKVYDKCLFNVK